MLLWTSSIQRHWYWSCESANNGEELREMVLAILKHVCDEHSFPNNKYSKECTHGHQTNKTYLANGHRAATNIESALRGYNDCRLRNLDKFVQNLTTIKNEVLRNFVSKDTFFSHQKKIAASFCATLHWNLNCNGKELYGLKIYSNKYQPNLRARRRHAKTSWHWQMDTLKEIFKVVFHHQAAAASPEHEMRFKGDLILLRGKNIISSKRRKEGNQFEQMPQLLF